MGPSLDGETPGDVWKERTEVLDERQERAMISFSGE